MKPSQLAIVTVLTVASVLGPFDAAQAVTFGEVALAGGGTFPQGSFTRYADPGFLVNVRATLHIPKVEVFAFWIDLGGASFSDEHHNTTADIAGGPSIPVIQTYSEGLFNGHIGLQLANMTRRAFFRPRAALGVGFYHFSSTMSWDMETVDTTINLATETVDSQTRLGWRVLTGADFFISTRLGFTADFVYDHVFDLNQTETPLPNDNVDLTSRFHGFTVGLVYMFDLYP